MAISSNTIFGIFEEDPANAKVHLFGNRFTKSTIEIGKNSFTIETIIHEIAELETLKILFNLKKYNAIITVDNYSNRIAHFLAPYGENSFLNPFVSDSIETPLL